MALVDYSDSASNESVDEEPPSKRRRAGSEAASDAAGRSAPAKDGASELPPLPSAFHDLYASTVRQSTSDDPSLHQGRRRLIPHVPGNWPSHVYVEWHPTNAQHDVLTRLLKDVEKELRGEVPLHGFLTSDLGAPLPLHISLSRPISLPTADKDLFYDRISSSIRTSGIEPFAVVPRGLAWHRSPDSERTFLILRVTAHASPANDASAPNPQLLTLLARCNKVATQFQQQSLYQRTPNEPVGTAFHVSIAWSFGMPDEDTSLRALKVLKQPRYADVRRWDIDVPGVKVKIGNVVHHVPLPEAGKKGTDDVDVFENPPLEAGKMKGLNTEEKKLERERAYWGYIAEIEEYREFKIMNPLVNDPDASPAAAVQQIVDLTKGFRETQLRGNHLWYTCCAFIELAQRTPPEDQTRLVEFVAQLSQTPLKDPENGRAMKYDGDLVWTEMPTFGYTVADEWYGFDVTDSENTPVYSARWLNFIGFLARVSNIMPDLDFTYYSLLAFDEAFRVAVPGELAVRTACMWMVHAGEKLWGHAENRSKRGFLSVMTRKMWYSWELGFERVRECVGREVREKVDEALVVMRRVERGKI